MVAAKAYLDQLADSDVLLERQCETTTGCNNEATAMVWCDHHAQGCDYTGFRCDVHLNLLHLETVRESEAIRRNGLMFCDRCGAALDSWRVSDHFRWVRL